MHVYHIRKADDEIIQGNQTLVQKHQSRVANVVTCGSVLL